MTIFIDWNSSRNAGGDFAQRLVIGKWWQFADPWREMRQWTVVCCNVGTFCEYVCHSSLVAAIRYTICRCHCCCCTSCRVSKIRKASYGEGTSGGRTLDRIALAGSIQRINQSMATNSFNLERKREHTGTAVRMLQCRRDLC